MQETDPKLFEHWVREEEQVDLRPTAAKYATLSKKEFWKSNEEFAEAVAAWVPFDFDGPIVDLGCGSFEIGAYLIKALEKLGKKNRVIGYDYDPGMLLEAQNTVSQEHIAPERVEFVQGDFAEMAVRLAPYKGAIFMSNTAFHEFSDLEKIFSAVAELDGACYFRDLLLPEHQFQADQWKAEGIGDVQRFKSEDPEGYGDYNRSQHAGFTPKMVKKAINATLLKGQGQFLLGNKKDGTSRYWKYTKEPKATMPRPGVGQRRR